MAYNFNNSPLHSAAQASAAGTPVASSPSDTRATVQTPAATAVPVAPGDAPATSDVPESAAWVRFRSCRWQQPKDEANPAEFCTHREVKPYAGTTGFDPDAWCPECQYYKLRRAPKKRTPSDDFSY